MEYSFECLRVSRPKEFVVHVELNRPDKRNALNNTIWKEIGDCFRLLADDPDCRSIVLSGAGKTFCAGLDFEDMRGLAAVGGNDSLDVARKGWNLRKFAKANQERFMQIEKCPKPVIAAIHGGCLGGAVGLVTCCDIRYCTTDCFFSIKEVDVGLVEDVGTLQRVPKGTGNDSLLRELAFTARNFSATEAYKLGIVSGLFQSKEEMMEATFNLANQIAQKSPVAVQGTKVTLNYARNHSVEEALDYIATWNMIQMQSEDTQKAAVAIASRAKIPPLFAKL